MENIGILTALALILTTYRITRLVTVDQFPFGNLRILSIGKPFLGELLICPFCVSVWAGIFMAIGQAFAGELVIWQTFIGAMSLSAIVSLMATLTPQTFE